MQVGRQAGRQVGRQAGRQAANSGVVVVERLERSLQFLSHLFLVNFAFISQKLAFDSNY